MPTILISGAASGLGAEFLRQYGQDEVNNIIAIDRENFKVSDDKVRTFAVDVSSQESISAFEHEIKDESIDLVIHSAGIRGLVPAIERQHPNNVHACETIDVMDLETMMKTFQINTAGTFMLLRAILPNLKKSQELAKVVVMSSRMASVGNNQHPNKDAGSAYAYRASKAALNMAVRSFAADVPEVAFVLCHPGRVETGLVKGKEEGAIEVKDSVEGLMPLIDRWGREDSGRFYDRFGEGIEW